MQTKINDHIYNVKIIRKLSTRNTYIRIKEDLTIYVTTNMFTTNREVVALIEKNSASLMKMIIKMEKKLKKQDEFYYLGKKYDIVYTNDYKVILGDEKVFIPRGVSINKWYMKMACEIFKKRLDYWYSRFTKIIPYPNITIRKMTTRWGVCNTRLKRVTLNLELIKKEIDCLDYVIVHELSHFIHANHSKEFWNVVLENYPNYKKIRKKMKEE